MKWAFWEAPPWALAALAKPNLSEARDRTRILAQRSEQSDDPMAQHHRATPPSCGASGVELFLRQHSACRFARDCPEVFVVAFAFVVKRWVEGTHSVVKCLAAHRAVSGPFSALRLRMSQVLDRTQTMPSWMKTLADSLTRNPRIIATRLVPLVIFHLYRCP